MDCLLLNNRRTGDRFFHEKSLVNEGDRFFNSLWCGNGDYSSTDTSSSAISPYSGQ
jgi:hypothetical protein